MAWTKERHELLKEAVSGSSIDKIKSVADACGARYATSLLSVDAARAMLQHIEELEGKIRRLYQQAKKCQNGRAAGLLLSAHRWCHSGETVFEGNESLAELTDRFCGGPAWHDRPTGPGLWVWWTTAGAFFDRLDEDDIRNWPSNRLRVFGPIPEEPSK